MSRWLVTQPERSYNRLRLYIALPFLRAGRNLGMQPPLQPPPSKPFRPLSFYCKELLKQYRIYHEYRLKATTANRLLFSHKRSL